MPFAPRDFVREFVERHRDRLADPILGQSAEARVVAKLLDELEAEHATFLDEKVSCVVAAQESGYSRQQIALLRRQGIITDRRGDLPRKPGHGVEIPKGNAVGGPSLADEVIAARRRGALRVG